MSVTLTGSGGFFTRVGALGGILADENSFRGGTATTNVISAASMPGRVAALLTSWENNTDDRTLLDGIYGVLSSWQSAQGGLLQQLQSYAQSTVVRMVDTDTPLASKTLSAALAALITQMTTAGDYIAASTVAAGSQTSVGSPNGTPIIVLSLKNGKGLTQQTVFAEKITFTVTSDSQGGATLNQEPLSVVGGAAQSDPLSQLWPAGSGASTSLTLADATQNNSAGNVLQNSEFLTFTTANNPDNWTLLIGAAGTDVFKGSSGYYDTSSLQFTGTGGGLLDSVVQTFGTTPSTGVGLGGTSYSLLPGTCYALNCWVKCSATPSAGVLEFALLDGSNTIFNDDASTANAFTKSLTAVSTSWVNVNGVFRTPAVLPSTKKLRIRLSTAIDSGKSVFIDRVALTPMTQMYAGGPFVASFSGSTKVITGDKWTITTTNSLGGFAALLEKFYSLRSLGLQFPYSGGGSAVNDNLIA